MTGDVVQPLLQHAIKRDVERLAQTLQIALGQKHAFNAMAQLPALGQRLHAGLQPELIQAGRTQLLQQIACQRMQLVGGLHDGMGIDVEHILARVL